jgi:hypothetical protein
MKVCKCLHIKPWPDYHGDPMVFTIEGNDGSRYGRFVSEAEAIEKLPLIAAQLAKPDDVSMGVEEKAADAA